MNVVAITDPADHPEAFGLIILGLFLLAGFAAHVLGRRVHVPRVTLLLLLGFAAGPSVFNLIPAQTSDWFPLAARLALSIIGFQLGERFFGKEPRKTGAMLLTMSITYVLFAAVSVTVVLLWFGFPLALALLLAGIAPACAPASILDVIREAEARGPVTNAVLGVVAIGDAWGVLLFSILLVVAQATMGQEVSATHFLHGVWEVVGGILLGILVGLPMAWLTGRIRPGELTLVETLGFVFLCSGLATRFELSHILACMSMGATVSNLARHHQRPFHAIEEVEQPFLITFFLLAGLSFDSGQLRNVGLAGGAYVMARSLGLIVGGFLGGSIAKAPRAIRTHVGWCLLPQAGIALGLALIAAERIPTLGKEVLSVVVGATIVFEIVGPILTRLVLIHAGEAAPRVAQERR